MRTWFWRRRRKYAESEELEVESRVAELVVLSGKSAGALDVMCGRLAEHLKGHPEQKLVDVAYSLATTRTSMEHRLALSVPTREALMGALTAASQGEGPSGSVRGKSRERSGKVVWLFTGQGSQEVGMGRGLYESWPAFREALDAACAVLDAEVGRAIREVMWGESGEESSRLLEQTQYTQPALFALGWAQAALWQSWGVEPSYVAGHSVGEVTAACVAGVMSLADGARLISARGRLMQGLTGRGAMVAIGASEVEVMGAVAPYATTVSIGAVNGPESVVISGHAEDVESIAADFAKRGIRTKRLAVSHAFHSPQMDGMLSEFGHVAETIEYLPSKVGIVSNVSGAIACEEISSAAYWVKHARAAVRFADGVRWLHEAGADTYLELGPKATLVGLVPSCLGDAEVSLLSTLRAGRPESESALEALGGYFVGGGQVDWSGVFPRGGRRVELPTYAWQRERYWVEAPRWQCSGRYGRRVIRCWDAHRRRRRGRGLRVAAVATEPAWLSGPS